MRFGIQQPIWEDWPTTLERWRQVDSSNYSTAYVPDHPGAMRINGVPTGTFDPWVLLAAVAPLTSRVGLGTKVSSVTFRHPTLLAKMAASVDVVSNGRVVVGLGTGWLHDDHGPLGFSMPPFDDRLEILADQLAVLRACWAGTPPEVVTGNYQLSSPTPPGPFPVQTGGPKTFIGGWSEGRLMEIAAQWCDGFNVPHLSASAVAHKRRVLASHCARVDRDPSTLEITADVILLKGATREEAAAMIDDLTRWRRSAGNRNAVADVGAVLFGEAAAITRAVQEFADAGVSELTISALGASFDDLIWFSEQVIPNFDA